MKKPTSNKKKLITSYEKLSDEIKELFKEVYAEGYSSFIQKIEKPNGETIFVVPLETEDTTFMVKVDVRVDSKFSEEEIEKEIFALPKEIEGEFAAETEEEEDKEHKEFELKHGSYEEGEEEDDEEGEENEEEESDDEK